MAEHRLPHIELFCHADNPEAFGMDQQWYKSTWQRQSGCGPTACAMQLYYLANTAPAAAPLAADMLSTMESCWQYVTPMRGGVSSTVYYEERALALARDRGVLLAPHRLDVPRKPDARKSFSELISFIAEGLRDCPVAFLNLSNGGVKHLYSWHWVSIVGMDVDGAAGCVISDEARKKTVNLARWYEKSLLGGGFVYFTLR